jgi:RNA polymerase sigma-70 factor (family 1)
MTSTDFNDFVKQVSRKLYGFAFRILQNQEEAEDAVQEVFIKMWKMGEKLNEYDSIEALATTITKNYCIDQLRKQKNVQKEGHKKEDYYYLTSPSPHEQMEIKETNDIICRIIDHLPDAFKVIIRLREIEGLSYNEISEKTDQNINTLRVTISRARRIIRDEYNNYQNEHNGIKQIVGKVL